MATKAQLEAAQSAATEFLFWTSRTIASAHDDSSMPRGVLLAGSLLGNISKKFQSHLAMIETVREDVAEANKDSGRVLVGEIAGETMLEVSFCLASRVMHAARNVVISAAPWSKDEPQTEHIAWWELVGSYWFEVSIALKKFETFDYQLADVHLRKEIRRTTPSEPDKKIPETYEARGDYAPIAIKYVRAVIDNDVINNTVNKKKFLKTYNEQKRLNPPCLVYDTFKKAVSRVFEHCGIQDSSGDPGT